MSSRHHSIDKLKVPNLVCFSYHHCLEGDSNVVTVFGLAINMTALPTHYSTLVSDLLFLVQQTLCVLNNLDLFYPKYHCMNRGW